MTHRCRLQPLRCDDQGEKTHPDRRATVIRLTLAPPYGPTISTSPRTCLPSCALARARAHAGRRGSVADRITVRGTGVFVGAGFAPAAARLHPEDRGRDAGALVFECRFAGAAANSVAQKV